MPKRFGPFLADRASYRLLRDGQPVALTPKLLDLLLHFVDHPGVLLTKEELLDTVWPGANVTDNALAQAISDLRDALDDDAASPSFIRTIARRGYRFIAAVTDAEAVPSRVSSDATTADRQPAAVAVLDFANVSGDPDIAWLSAGIAETVTSDLATLDHFRVIDRWRVIQAARRSGASGEHVVAAEVGAALVVTGSVQRSGPRVRITARLVDLASSESIAEAKVDGVLDDIFSLQDAIVRTFVRQLNLPSEPETPRHGARETSSLHAYRAYTEGWLKIESLDTALVPAAIADFTRAIESDPGYAMAYTGLANAEFVAFEMTRAAVAPATHALRDALAHARQAVRLDETLAEAHATLSFLLATALEFEDARAAARRAVALEPDSWRHQYRLGHASWGDDRLRAFDYVHDAYPQFAYAQFERAMVLVARGDPEGAARIARSGVHDQDRQAQSGNRFPAIGFHWLLGAIEAASGRHEAAVRHFDRELDLVDPRRLYGPEYGAVALVGRGHAELALGDPTRALESFRQAQSHIDRHARALAGEAAALERLGRPKEAAQAWQAAEKACAGLAATERGPDARIAQAAALALRQDAAAALAEVDALFDALPPCHVGWFLPLEPAFGPVRNSAPFQERLHRLADRAR